VRQKSDSDCSRTLPSREAPQLAPLASSAHLRQAAFLEMTTWKEEDPPPFFLPGSGALYLSTNVSVLVSDIGKGGPPQNSWAKSAKNSCASSTSMQVFGGMTGQKECRWGACIFTLPPGGSKARNEPSGRVDGGSVRIPTTLPGNSLTLVSDPPGGRV
jgi:hypothetical protein